MRPAPAPKTLTLALLLLFPCVSARAGAPCAVARTAWDSVQSYRCVYRAVTRHEGKTEESLMRYMYEKPGRIRMDIEKPRKGAVLIYNPKISDKVRIRPFPTLSKFILSYELTHKRVTSDSGGTVDKSDLGHRGESFCAELDRAGLTVRNNPDYTEIPFTENGKMFLRKYSFGPEGLLRKIEVLDQAGTVVELFEWTDLELNPTLSADTFTKF